jgi:hypothetical protein
MQLVANSFDEANIKISMCLTIKVICFNDLLSSYSSTASVADYPKINKKYQVYQIKNLYQT